jgi:hypothetical protein
MVKAGGPTGEEFKDVIRAVYKQWREKGESVRPVWSWDNARIHGNVLNGDWELEDISAGNHTQLPPYSPDMHSVIELSHALLMHFMQDFINKRRNVQGDSVPMYVAKMQELFYKHVTAPWAQKTTHRLFLKVLPAILDAQGQYPPKGLR